MVVGEDMMSLTEMESGRRDKGFERVINSKNCRQTLLILEPWLDPRPVTRVWCLSLPPLLLFPHGSRELLAASCCACPWPCCLFC